MTTTAKVTHTPGPWSCNQRGLSVFATRDHQQERIAKAELLRAINEDDISAEDACEEEQANTHLIAAAPDMLEALEDALEILEEAHIPATSSAQRAIRSRVRHWKDKASAAIAKAKGGAA